MNYTPKAVLARRFEEMDISRIDDPRRQPGIFRRLSVISHEKAGGKLWIKTELSPLFLAIPCESGMTFGHETVTAETYADRVLEPGDLIDAALLAPSDGVIPVAQYWIHIVYQSQRMRPPRPSEKEDGLFAMRTKAGEKA